MAPRCCIKSTELNDFQLKIFDAHRPRISCFEWEEKKMTTAQGDSTPLPYKALSPPPPQVFAHPYNLSAKHVMTYNINFLSLVQTCNYSVIIFLDCFLSNS